MTTVALVIMDGVEKIAMKTLMIAIPTHACMVEPAL